LARTKLTQHDNELEGSHHESQHSRALVLLAKRQNATAEMMAAATQNSTLASQTSLKAKIPGVSRQSSGGEASTARNSTFGLALESALPAS
jgi:hypothetical protein